MAKKRGTAPPQPETASKAVSGPVRRQAIRYTREQVARQFELAEQALIAGIDERATAHRVMQETGIGRRRAAVIIQRVYEAWAREDAQKRPAWKASQIRRVMSAARLAMSGRDAVVRDGVVIRPAVRPNLQAHARYEELLSKIQGTQEAIEVHVDHDHAVLGVMANLTPEDVAALVAKAERGLELAEQVDARPPRLDS